LKKFILPFIYYFVKGLTKLTFWGFYRHTTILHPEHLKLDNGPYILVSNHPNTLIDPLQAAIGINRFVYFLANAGLFKTPFTNWFFTTFYCIRIERPTDVKGRPLQNDIGFALCDLHLNKGGVLYIAPEAYSYKGRKLMPLKTGTARIALSAERKQNFELGLKILPVGLNYSSPYDFRSDILIHVGEPLLVSDFAADYKKDAFGAARLLTDQLEKRFGALMLTTQDGEEDELLRQLEELLQNDQPLSRTEQHFRAQKILSGIQNFRKEQETEWLNRKIEMNSYFDEIKAADLSDRDIARPGSCHLLRRSLLAFISLPFFIYGWVNNYLPAFVPAWTVRKLKQAEEYDATVKMLTGIITFPLFYFLQYKLVGQFFSSPYPLFYLLSLVPMGLLAWNLKEMYTRLQYSWRFQTYRREQPDGIRSIFQKRVALMEWVERMRNEE